LSSHAERGGQRRVGGETRKRKKEDATMKFHGGRHGSECAVVSEEKSRRRW